MNLKVEIKWGVIISVAFLAWITLEFLLGFHTERIEMHPVITNFSLLIPAFGIYMAFIEKRKSNNDILSYKESVITGIIVSAIVAVLSIPGQYIFHNFINPDFFTAMVAHSKQVWLNDGFSEEKATIIAEAAFNFKAYLIESVLGALIGGTVLSLILGFLVKKAPIEDVID